MRHTAKGLKEIDGGKRGATTGLLDVQAIDPEGITANRSISLLLIPSGSEIARVRRVGAGDCSPEPLTEPDLWITHPALQVGISIKQQHIRCLQKC